jgi:hypothetical protein
MSITTAHMQELAENYASTMKSAFAAGSLNDIDALIDDRITLFTPRHFKPVRSKPHVRAIIRALPQFIEGFHYNRHFIKDNEVVMEFKGTIDDMEIQGLEIFTLSDEGKALQAEVFVRPSKSLAALSEKEDAYIADVMAGKISID